MNALTQSWIEIGTLSDIPVRGARCVHYNDLTIAIFRTADDQVYALEDKCPHRNGPLSQGIVHDGCVTCPLHNWIISLESGKATGADEGRTNVYPIRLDGDRLLLSVDPTKSAGDG